MNASWIIPFIILGGALQTCGAAMNGQLNKSLVNPCLASAVLFLIVTFFFIALFFAMPHPLPAMQDLREMPWWRSSGSIRVAQTERFHDQGFRHPMIKL